MRAFLLLLLAAVASAKLAPVFTQVERIPGRYIVKLKEGKDVDATLADLGGISVHRKFTKVFPGFAADLSESMIENLRKSDAVEYIEEDAVYRTNAVDSWGLDRIDQISLPLDDSFTPIGDGSDVDVYILDTGINYDHEDFGGRAFFGVDPIGGTGVDCNGHGSHCAGTSVGTRYGVAKAAHVYAVRILNCLGSGSTSDIVAGCDWIVENHTGPSVASMSLGGGASSALDAGVQGMIDAGITVSVSAGNDDGNACSKSPARVEQAITVGATDDTDTRASFSNYGVCVDIFGPGVDITSAWYNSNNATNTISGTSMSCPHVAGAAAVMLGNDETITPIQMKEQLQLKAIGNVINDAGPGSPNLLLYIGAGDGGGFIPGPVDDGCGGYFNASSGEVASPWWPYDYDNSMDCYYDIVNNGAGSLILDFDFFELESSSTCNWDYLSIYDGSDATAPFMGKYCGTDTPVNITSSGTNLYLHFHSDGSVIRPGFHANYFAAQGGGCGDVFTSEYGMIESPNYPNKYDDNINCDIVITGVADKVTTLTFDHFDVEKHTECSYDGLEIYDGSDATGQLLGHFCGPDMPPPVQSSVGNGLYLMFHTDASVSRTGFKATYKIE